MGQLSKFAAQLCKINNSGHAMVLTAGKSFSGTYSNALVNAHSVNWTLGSSRNDGHIQVKCVGKWITLPERDLKQAVDFLNQQLFGLGLMVAGPNTASSGKLQRFVAATNANVAQGFNWLLAVESDGLGASGTVRFQAQIGTHDVVDVQPVQAFALPVFADLLTTGSIRLNIAGHSAITHSSAHVTELAQRVIQLMLAVDQNHLLLWANYNDVPIEFFVLVLGTEGSRLAIAAHFSYHNMRPREEQDAAMEALRAWASTPEGIVCRVTNSTVYPISPIKQNFALVTCLGFAP